MKPADASQLLAKAYALLNLEASRILSEYKPLSHVIANWRHDGPWLDSSCIGLLVEKVSSLEAKSGLRPSHDRWRGQVQANSKSKAMRRRYNVIRALKIA